jgi:MFS family permease
MLVAFSVAQVVFAPFSSAIKNRIGTKNTILFGFFMLTITTFGLGAIAKINDAYTFKYVGDSMRFLQGFGDILLQVTCYNLVCNIYSD